MSGALPEVMTILLGRSIVPLSAAMRCRDCLEGWLDWEVRKKRDMLTARWNTRTYESVLWVAVMAGWFASGATAAERLSSGEQNGLVQKYCAVCHTDAARNGGLSLQHYDSAEADPALAAMLLSKLRNGAMGAAGVGIPEPAVREAWVAATAAQAARSKSWSVIHAEAPGSHAPVLVASIVRDVAPRMPGADGPVYRLTLECNVANQKGTMQLTWSPAPQTDRTFSVAVDGNAGIPHRLEGRESTMGNGNALTTGLAAAMLRVTLPRNTLTVTDLFRGETVVFPIADLDQVDRRQLAACFSADGRRP